MMMYRIFRLVVLACLAATPSLAAGDPTAGAQRAQLCAGCHGQAGISSMKGVPTLAGQQDQYIQWQLVFFRSGRRDNPAMMALAAALSDADIRDLGAYYASLPRGSDKPVSQPDPELRNKGQAIAAEHHCANCHEDNFLGKRAAAAIADQREEYLVKALSDYRSTARPSTGVAAMSEAAAALNDDEIAALAHYLASL